MSNSSTTIGKRSNEGRLPPVHPGEVLREEFLVPHALSAGAVARAIHVPRTRIERLVAETVDLSPDTALRLARYFGTSPASWMAIQSRYALEKTGDAIAVEIAAIAPVCGRLG
jgi:addiction module HigA family antidote